MSQRKNELIVEVSAVQVVRSRRAQRRRKRRRRFMACASRCSSQTRLRGLVAEESTFFVFLPSTYFSSSFSFPPPRSPPLPPLPLGGMDRSFVVAVKERCELQKEAAPAAPGAAAALSKYETTAPAPGSDDDCGLHVRTSVYRAIGRDSFKRHHSPTYQPSFC